MVDGQVAHQPDAVGILSPQRSIGQRYQGVDRTCTLRLTAQGVGQSPGTFLEWNGYVEPAAALLKETDGILFKVLEIPKNFSVSQIFTGLFCKCCMDEGGFAVLDRVADDRVPVLHAVHFQIMATLVVTTRPAIALRAWQNRSVCHPLPLA